LSLILRNINKLAELSSASDQSRQRMRQNFHSNLMSQMGRERTISSWKTIQNVQIASGN
jgi:hypothetical protein